MSMPPDTRPERCPFCAGFIESLYVIETTPTHGARFVEVEGVLRCSNGGILMFVPQEAGAPGRFAGMHPAGTKIVYPGSQ